MKGVDMKFDKYEIFRQLEMAGLKKKDVAAALKLSAPSLSKRFAGMVPFNFIEKTMLCALIDEGRDKKGMKPLKTKLFK